MANRRVGMFGVEPNDSIENRTEDGVAALLRRRREELGRDVASVARQLRIRAIYIQAIEDGRLQDLPGTAYAVGFVRAYADYLGLDGNSIVSDYRDELARHSRQNQLIWPVDQVEHKHFPGGIILVVSLVVAVVLYGGWYFASQPGGTGIDLIDQVPEFMKKQTGGSTTEEATDPTEGTVIIDNGSASVAVATNNNDTPAASSAQASQAEAVASEAEAVALEADSVAAASSVDSTPAAPPADDANPAVLPEDGATAATSNMPPDQDEVAPAIPATTDSSAAAATVPAVTPSVEAPAVPAAGTDSVAQVASTASTEGAETTTDTTPVEKRIVLRATKDSWVEIFDSSQNVVLQRILRAGETYAVPDQAGLVMNTGNAGGLVIEVDGRAQPSLGSIGVVKRGIKLEPDSFAQQ